MAKNNKGQNSILSFCALMILMYFLGLPLIAAILQAYFGSIGQVITNAIDMIPFGETYFELGIQIVNAIGGQVVNYADMTGSLTFGYITTELAKALFTVIMFEAVNFLAGKLMGFADGGKIKPTGIWNKAKFMLISVFNALLAAFLAPIPMNYIFDHFHMASEFWQTVISIVLSTALVGGGISFFALLCGMSALTAILYVVGKFFVVGACRISISYIAIFVVLIGWQNGLPIQLITGMSCLLVVGLVLGGIEMLIGTLRP